MKLEKAKQDTQQLQDISVLLSGPCKVEYEDANGIYVGKFKDGQKSGKGILVDKKGNKMIAVWERSAVVGRLYWNYLNGLSDFGKQQQGSQKALKSSFKTSTGNKQFSSTSELGPPTLTQSIIEGLDDGKKEEVFNHYHPHRAISSKKSKSAKISKISAEGQFAFSEKGGLEQSGYGRLNLSDGSFYQGYFSKNLFDQYGCLKFSDGSYYRG